MGGSLSAGSAELVARNEQFAGESAVSVKTRQIRVIRGPLC